MLQHADSLKQQYADVVAEVYLLTGVGVCHSIATHFSAPSHEYVQLAPVELQQGIGKSVRSVSQASHSVLTTSVGDPCCMFKERLETSGGAALHHSYH